MAFIHKNDERAALEFGKAIRESFANNLVKNKKAIASNTRNNLGEYGASMAIDASPGTYWATDDNTKNATITIDMGKPTLFNRVMIQEYIRLGQRVKSFTISALIEGSWKEIAKGTTIGYKRIARFPSVKATKVCISITDSKCSPAISNIGIFNAPLFLDAPTISRNQEGKVTISTDDVGPVFFYTVDGSLPTTKSNRYTIPFLADGKIEIKAISYDPATSLSSPVTSELFDISKINWHVLGVSDNKAAAIFDGDTSTVYHQKSENLPIDIVVDLGNSYNIIGFKYLPDQQKWSSGIISKFEFYVSDDNLKWSLADHGEFSNIKNNPVLQQREFGPLRGRYIKLRALKNTAGDNVAGYAEIDVITK